MPSSVALKSCLFEIGGPLKSSADLKSSVYLKSKAELSADLKTSADLKSSVYLKSKAELSADLKTSADLKSSVEWFLVSLVPGPFLPVIKCV